MNTIIIRAIIIDDEQEGRDVLEFLLNQIPEINLVEICDGPESGLNAIVHEQPDLVFMDIKMPKKSGLEVAKEISNLRNRPAVVFVTAYDKFAIQAFRVAAFDFLLKPVDPDELNEIISRFRKENLPDDFERKIDILFERLYDHKRLRFNTHKGFTVIELDEILYIKAEGRYSEVYLTGNRKECLVVNIGQLERQLSADHLFKGSRSVILNINYLKAFHRSNRICVLQHNEETYNLKISKDAVNALEKKVVSANVYRN